MNGKKSTKSTKQKSTKSTKKKVQKVQKNSHLLFPTIESTCRSNHGAKKRWILLLQYNIRIQEPKNTLKENY